MRVRGRGCVCLRSPCVALRLWRTPCAPSCAAPAPELCLVFGLRDGGALASDASEGGQVPSAPLQGAQPMPSHCLSDCKCQFHWHL